MEVIKAFAATDNIINWCDKTICQRFNFDPSNSFKLPVENTNNLASIDVSSHFYLMRTKLWWKLVHEAWDVRLWCYRWQWLLYRNKSGHVNSCLRPEPRSMDLCTPLDLVEGSNVHALYLKQSKQATHVNKLCTYQTFHGWALAVYSLLSVHSFDKN